jgi:hypothetical protein
MHQAIVSAASAAFPGVHFEFYRADRVNLPFGDGTTAPTAYVLMELREFDVGESIDPGTEQQAMMARFEAEVVMKTLPTDARLGVRILAAAFAAFLRKTLRWPGVLNGPIMVHAVHKDDFSPELDQYEVWRVEWMQEVWLGVGTPWTDAFNYPDVPHQVLLGFVPVVGIPNEPDYINMDGSPR